MIEVRTPGEYKVVYHDEHPLIAHRHNKQGNNVFSVRAEVLNWLRANFGYGQHFTAGGRGNYVFETSEHLWSWDFDGNGGDVVFYFKDTKHAMLFKLTWIGQ